MSDLTSKKRADRLRELADMAGIGIRLGDDAPIAKAIPLLDRIEIGHLLRAYAALLERPSEAQASPSSNPEDTLAGEGREYAEFLKSEGVHGYTVVKDLASAVCWLTARVAELERPQEATGAYSGLIEIRRYIQYWLDYNERTHKQESLEVTDDTHVIPPYWPSRGSLKAWIHGIDKAMPSPELLCTSGCHSPICEKFVEKDDGEGRVSTYCETCGHTNECHEPVKPHEPGEDARDAARYRWLRSRESQVDALIAELPNGDGYRLLEGAELDESIDQARRSVTKGETP